MTLSPHIFRACDIRGIVDETLTEEVASLIGQSFGTLAQENNQSTVVVGRDGRLSSERLSEALIQGLCHTGCTVMDIGQVPTPVVYYATFAFQTGTGIMITGSHNPLQYNGFKMMLKKDTLAEEMIQTLYRYIQAQHFLKGDGRSLPTTIIAHYIQQIQQAVTLAAPLKIAVDCGNGVVGVLARALFEALGCEVLPLYCEVDGRFPFHHPDPGQPQNLHDLIQVVRQEHCDLGLAFDGDGDRLGVVSPTGDIIWPDRIMMLFARDLLQRKPGAPILFDVKCSNRLAEEIARLGGEPVMYKTGHALMKRKMREIQAPLAGEMSGHFFFQERWYGFDDACYAAARLLEIVAQAKIQGQETVFQDLPNSVNTPEITVAIPEEKKFQFIEHIKQKHGFQNATLITVDGLRAEFSTGWGLVRASNTTPSLILRFEAETKEALSLIQASFKKAMLLVEPSLQIPF